MSGRRRSGHAAAAGLNLVSEFLLEEQKAKRARREHAIELYQKFQYEQQVLDFKNQMAEQNRAAILGTPLAENETRTLTSPGGISQSFYGKNRLAGANAKPPTGLPAAQAAQLLGTSQPGTPLPLQRPVFDGQGNEVRRVANLPVGPQGQVTMNQAIEQGMTESPAAQPLGNRIAPHLIPQGPFVAGPGGTAIGGQMDPASTGGGISREAILALLGQIAPPRPPVLAAPQAMRPAVPMAQPQATAAQDPIIRTGVDEATGRRVGMTQSGQVVFLD